MSPVHNLWKRLLSSSFPVGHPAMETLLERSARNNAYRVGYALGRIFGVVAPGLDVASILDAFKKGLTDAERAGARGAKIYDFPGPRHPA